MMFELKLKSPIIITLPWEIVCNVLISFLVIKSLILGGLYTKTILLEFLCDGVIILQIGVGIEKEVCVFW
ncbi:unnamed protein product [Meloidogyne enterolobii]|uniref:Uncharacterized protein n=1 Tax=Meloidogyne enterolobii TaxID=390850 RepID=A0ACB0YTF9_MELEN